ncbi:hypothetical protein JMN32_23895 [Fulvivirga sp. 29W222]|uniref:Uncharacterized protein n=1 Tax=Fulvivirga marina TaxID=2494733 RepID=A0A937KGG0_9BACT|nr:hypothetical protein [Fulvivirga marina]MBL6449375.1 hypothetical protein [Fulvivirga marina]
MIILKPFHSILSLLVVLVLTGCDCQYEISGVVLDEASKLPIQNVAIGQTDTTDLDKPFNQKIFTKKYGKFDFREVAQSCDEVTLYFSHQEYFTEKVTLPNNSNATIYLSRKRKTNSFFDRQREYKIKNLTKKNDSPSSMNDTTMCSTWNLTEKQVRVIIGNAKEIDGPKWHYKFEHLPCRVTGELVQNTKKYLLSINSGAWLTVSSNDTTLMYGIFSNSIDPYFVSSAWTEGIKKHEQSK